MAPSVVIGVVSKVIPSNAEGNLIGLSWEGALNGGVLNGNTLEISGDCIFTVVTNPIAAYETAIVDAVVAKASEVGYTVSRTNVFFPVYKRGV